MTVLRKVPNDRVPVHWARALPYLEAACARSHGDTTTDELCVACVSGGADLWLIEVDGHLVGAGVTQVAQQSDGRLALYVLAVGAEREPDWTLVAGLVENEARERGAKLVRWVGRRGWVKVLPGYDEAAVMMVKELV